MSHLSIVGMFLGTLILIIGLLLKKTGVQLTALGVFIFSDITSILAFYIGEGAEEIVKKMFGISETLLHTHEKYAKSFFILSLVLGTMSLIAFIAELRKSKYAKHLMVITLLLAMANVVLAVNVGTSGEEIRHTELRNEVKMIPLDSEDTY